MDSKLEKQMAKMVTAVQPHCDEPILSAMTCSHAGSMSSTLMAKLMDGIGGVGTISHTSDLPNPVFIAVGERYIYAFKYKPWWFKFKIKKEVARWPREELSVVHEETRMMCYFILKLKSGETYSMEIPIMMGGRELAQMFLDSFHLRK